MNYDKQFRLGKFVESLEAAALASNAADALELLRETLKQVEDTYSGVEFDPDYQINPASLESNRMYPPAEDNRQSTSRYPNTVRYRNRRHSTYISETGAIRIEDLKGNCLLSKADNAGREISS